MNNTLQQMEESLKSQAFIVFKNCGYENGLAFIKDELLNFDEATEDQKDNFIVATFDALDDGNTIFNNAIKCAAGLYFRGNGEYAKEETCTDCKEYLELMDAIKFIRTRIH